MLKTKVLFLCTGNSARSQMAEAFLRELAGDDFEAYSAGLTPKEIHPLTLQVMEEIGIDMTGHRSKSIQEYLGRKHFSYLVTVCSDAEKKCPSLLPGINKRIPAPFEDPAAFQGTPADRLNKFREVRDQIRDWVTSWVASRPA